MRQKLAAFQNSRAGQFWNAVMDDRAPNLAVLLAWGTLNTLFPLVLGIVAIAGFVLRDPQRLDQVNEHPVRRAATGGGHQSPRHPHRNT
jgi:uncharacterized BrkB/YihY/UPF0761 family membrane protein